MIDPALEALVIRPHHPLLWVIKTYLDLVSGDEPLVAGSGLKRLFVMSAGMDTLNQADIEHATQKAMAMKIFPSMEKFMNHCITTNLSLYAREMHQLIMKRIVAIADGDVKNVQIHITSTMDEARRQYYLPEVTFLQRIKQALNDDQPIKDWKFISVPDVVHPLEDVAMDAGYLLARLQSQEGFNTPNPTTWGALVTVVERLVDTVCHEAVSQMEHSHYKTRARACVKILWVITKMLYGDLTSHPRRSLVNLVDLDDTICMSNGTLAAIPFPLKPVVQLFSDEDHIGTSMKGKLYLSAVSAAILYRSTEGSDG